MKKPFHYMTKKMVKMGKWYLRVLDSETWHSPAGNNYFKKQFGIPKGGLTLQDVEGSWQHMYFPLDYFTKVYNRIDQINKKDYKSLERKLKGFYVLEQTAKTIVSKNFPSDLSKISNGELAKIFKVYRDLLHRVTIYDQFGWLAEEYWTPKMENILVDQLHLKPGSKEYNRVLFILTKPERISTTLREKLEAAEQTIEVKKSHKTLDKAAEKLAEMFGWMPIFTHGTEWKSSHYRKEIADLLKRTTQSLQKEISELKDYSKLRNKNISLAAKQFHLSDRQLQVFIDFGLALDARNEAEYFVSYTGQYLMRIYEEIQKRLDLKSDSLRNLFEDEIVACLLGRKKVRDVVKTKRGIVGWGFDVNMSKRILLYGKEARNLFEHLEKTYLNPRETNEYEGLCASPGYAKGQARIVHSPRENDKVKKGDILITHATTVDYLPAMKKAAAIITEVGGLTCHAAVVSREFKIPCIVSLKGAMTKFKDGNKIEVNADKGEVKLLKK